MSANTAILKNICYLKELSGSSNPNEVAAAAAAADRLIQKYRIDETELYLSSGRKKTPPFREGMNCELKISPKYFFT